MHGWLWLLAALAVLVVAIAVYDLTQREHAILRNFPLIGHLRYLLESIGPELRQYIVTDNRQERPFDRDQRRWIYSSAKGQNNNFAFGTDTDLETTADLLIIDQSAFPLPRPARDDTRLPCAKVLGAARDRRHAFRPASVVNISAMSYGALSGPAIEALNRGAAHAGCLHNTGEGGISPFHDHGGELIFQVGTGYFGCRDSRGRFDLPRLVELTLRYPIRAVEIKLSQGAKPGLGGMLPGVKVTPEIAAVRGIPVGQDCRSPSAHTAFGDVDSLLDFVETVADATGLPVGIKSAVGSDRFWHKLADEMRRDPGRGVDFITIDGGEGGTGDAPLAFSDHVAFPFKLAFARAYRAFAEVGITDDIVFIGSGRLGMPETALAAMALGADLIGVAREAMLAIGCIQAQRCHTGRCPVGVATQNAWRARGLDAELKAVRLANYVATLRHELLELAHACGVTHPRLVGLDRIEVLDGHLGSRTLRDIAGYDAGWARIPHDARRSIDGLMTPTSGVSA